MCEPDAAVWRLRWEILADCVGCTCPPGGPCEADCVRSTIYGHRERIRALEEELGEAYEHLDAATAENEALLAALDNIGLRWDAEAEEVTMRHREPVAGAMAREATWGIMATPPENLRVVVAFAEEKPCDD